MGNEAREGAQVRHKRRERLRRQMPFAYQLLGNAAVARKFIDSALLGRVLVGLGISPVPDFGLDNFDACVAILKDGLGIAYLSDAQFEQAMRLATPPEFRETEH